MEEPCDICEGSGWADLETQAGATEAEKDKPTVIACPGCGGVGHRDPVAVPPQPPPDDGAARSPKASLASVDITDAKGNFVDRAWAQDAGAALEIAVRRAKDLQTGSGGYGDSGDYRRKVLYAGDVKVDPKDKDG